MSLTQSSDVRVDIKNLLGVCTNTATLHIKMARIHIEHSPDFLFTPTKRNVLGLGNWLGHTEGVFAFNFNIVLRKISIDLESRLALLKVVSVILSYTFHHVVML